MYPVEGYYQKKKWKKIQKHKDLNVSVDIMFFFTFQYTQGDKTAAKPQHLASGFQKLLLRSGQEQNNASSELTSQESQEPQSPTSQEEIGK